MPVLLRSAWLAAVLGVTAPAPASAQPSIGNEPQWTFRTGLLITGSSDHSEPAGFSVYSAVALDAAVTRSLSRRFAAEISLRTESREVDRAAASGPAHRLGSLELLPLTAAVRYELAPGRSVRPYLGAGANLTVAWEKSGVLDSMDVRPHLGPALQIGIDVPLGTRALFNAGLRWNALTTDLENSGSRFARLRIDPVALGVGVGFRF